MNIDTAFFYSYTASCENRIRKSPQVPSSPFNSLREPRTMRERSENGSGFIRVCFAPTSE